MVWKKANDDNERETWTGVLSENKCNDLYKMISDMSTYSVWCTISDRHFYLIR